MLKYNIFLKRSIKKLTVGFSKKMGKNCYGRITVFHKQSFFKKKIRIVNFKQIFCSEGCLLRLESIPMYTSLIGLIFFFIGIFCYIIVPEGMVVGDNYKGFFWKIQKNKNYTIFLKNCLVGVKLFNVELKPGNGGQVSRAAGTFSFFFGSRNGNVYLKLPSGILVRLSGYCIGSFGIVSNRNLKLDLKKKAGIMRLYGRRPIVRGVAMNPVDHPHGGGEGRKSKPVLQKTPWGKVGKFKKTRLKKNFVKIVI